MDVLIDGLGAAGDGLAVAPDGTRLFIPGVLPGERVRVEGPVVLSPSPDRVTPPCPHYGPCGGCVTQHLAPGPYSIWKRARLVEALERAGFHDPAVAATEVSPPQSRRRADLALKRRTDGSVALGFHARGDSTRVEDLSICQVLDPRLVALFEPLRAMLRSLPSFRRDGSAMLNLLESGPDLLLRLDGTPGVQERATLAAFAQANRIPRIAGSSLKGQVAETLAQVGPVSIAFAGVPVTPPSGAFLQATPQGEAAIVRAVLAGLPKKLTSKSRIAELHAGLGTLSFPISAVARVAAFESAPETVAALDAAARKSGGRVVATKRDLVRQPLSPKELEAFAGLVLDPPFSGAAEQMPALAASKLSRIVYVSCNPAALTRDAKTLLAGGWRIQAATPIDQFLWSAQLEAVVVFAKGK